MTVLDLIIKLQDLPPNKEVMIDVTSKDSIMWKFAEINSVEEISYDIITTEHIVLLSPVLIESVDE